MPLTACNGIRKRTFAINAAIFKIINTVMITTGSMNIPDKNMAVSVNPETNNCSKNDILNALRF